MDVELDERSDEDWRFQVRRKMHKENRSAGSTKETLLRWVNGRMRCFGPGTTPKSTWMQTE